MAENSLVEKWKELAQEDLRAADQLKSGASLLLSMFHLQQALEKYLKAYIVSKINQQPPYIILNPDILLQKNS
ncbi:MAG TPA: HEPN domain-containing protein [Pseudobdellovibrionaceae bacterium]|nr:HEPN domain-containing protein [Pseudobdellovibrionaceae bacterium]